MPEEVKKSEKKEKTSFNVALFQNLENHGEDGLNKFKFIFKIHIENKIHQ